jgi:bacterioferritin
MQADPRILEVLNEILTSELTSVNQYFIHAKMCSNWGFEHIAARVRHESIDEMKHAESLIERILYLDGVPNLQRLNPVRVGETVPEQFEIDLATEVEAIARFNRGVALAVEVGDNGTRELLADMLVSEEEHADWLETQLYAISQTGLENYLAAQLRD